MSPSLVKMWPTRPLTLGELYVMVIALPAMVAVAVAGGLFGGPFGGPICMLLWADRVAATMRRPVQTKRRFMVMYYLQAEPMCLLNGSDGTIVAPCAPVREAAQARRAEADKGTS
jgi:hypothetical protein